MRHAFLAITLASLSACSVHTAPSLDPLVALIREQNDQIKALQEQMTLMQNHVAGLKDRPVSAAARQGAPTTTAPVDSLVRAPRYRMITSPVAGLNNMDAIYVMEQNSSRMVVLAFNANNEKLEIIAARSLNRDVKPGNRERTTAAPVALQGGSSIVVARGSDVEHVLVVTDDANQRLLIYKLDSSRRRLELAGHEDLQKIFSVRPENAPALRPAAPAAPSPLPPPPPPPTLPDPPSPPPPPPSRTSPGNAPF